MINVDTVSITGEIEFRRILEFDMQARVNEHAKLEVYGMVDKAYEEGFGGITNKKLFLNYELEGEYIPIFAGTVQSAKMSFAGDECYLRLNCVSASYEFDKTLHSRSYQDKHMNYRNLLDTVAGKGRNILFSAQKGAETGTPLVQYEETDWEFCRRIAGRFSTVVIPEITNLYPQLAVGMVKGKQYVLADSAAYELRQDLEGYRRKRQYCQCHAGDFSVYTVSSDQDYRLGDKILFMDNWLAVLAKHAYTGQSKVEMVYELGKEIAMGLEPCYNHKICGLSLKGTVRWREREKIKVSLDMDGNQNQDIGQLHAFSYMPVSGNLMYTMPEVGTQVWLYFPEANERSGMIVGSVNEDTDYPDSCDKLLETLENKRMTLKPEGIICESMAGQAFTVTDGEGIGWFTPDKVHITAQRNIRIQTGGIVDSSTPLGYHFENKQSGDSMDISGNEILMSAQRAVISALPHKLGGKPKQTETVAGLSAPSGYISNILGGIPQGEAVSSQTAAVLGGIAVYGNPDWQCNPSDMVFLGRQKG